MTRALYLAIIILLMSTAVATAGELFTILIPGQAPSYVLAFPETGTSYNLSDMSQPPITILSSPRTRQHTAIVPVRPAVRRSAVPPVMMAPAYDPTLDHRMMLEGMEMDRMLDSNFEMLMRMP